MQNTTSTAQAGASGTAQATVQGPTRFDAFIAKLHAWEKLPVVHSKIVDTSVTAEASKMPVRKANGKTSHSSVLERNRMNPVDIITTEQSHVR